MSETAAATKTDVASEAPAGQLPAVQDRRPRMPSNRRVPIFGANVAKAILAVSKDIGKIAKEGKNTFQNYKYAKWEDINERLSPLLVEHGLVLIQNEQSRSLLEENAMGSVLAIVYHFTLLHAETGEQWPPIEWTGIARLRDSKGVTDDKAATKCHTQAEKYFCVKQFKIVIDDAAPEDRHTSLPKKDAREAYSKMQAEIRAQTSLVELGIWGNHNNERKRTLPPDWQEILTELYNEKKAELENTQREAGEEVTWDEETGEVNDD